MARLRTQGVFQWHGLSDPVSVETCSCARTYSHCGIPARVRSRLGTRDAVHRSLGAVTLCADVACLEWGGWIRELQGIAPARAVS